MFAWLGEIVLVRMGISSSFKHIRDPQGNVFTHVASDAILFSLCIWNPQSGISSSFKHIRDPQGNVFTHVASDAIVLSLCIWNPQSGIVSSFKHIHASQGNVFTRCPAWCSGGRRSSRFALRFEVDNDYLTRIIMMIIIILLLLLIIIIIQ